MSDSMRHGASPAPRAARAVPVLVAALLTASCADVPVAPTPIVAPPENGIAMAEIPDWPYFAPVGDFVYALPAWVTPGMCYADLDPSISTYRDADRDWLADDCELELARMFAPVLNFSSPDACPGGEPAWAAKYFNTARVVRIAYLPAYYTDCGNPSLGFGGGHNGDSEMIMIEVRFDVIAQRWRFEGMWLSAHYKSGILDTSDRSAWVTPDVTNFSTLPGAMHPQVWVAYRKHANYKSWDTCMKTFFAVEYCATNPTPVRFPVRPERNIGGRHRALLDCVASTDRFAGNGAIECFWSGRRVLVWNAGTWSYKIVFGGWHGALDFLGTPGSSPYRDVIMSDKYENRCAGVGPIYCITVGDWGPGPTPPSPPSEPWYPPPSDCSDPTQILCQPALLRAPRGTGR